MGLSDIKTYGGEVSRLLESISSSADRISYKKKERNETSTPYTQTSYSENRANSSSDLSGLNTSFIEPEVSVSIQEYISQHPFKDSAAEKYKRQAYSAEVQSQNFLANNTDFSWSKLEYAVESYNYVKEINTPPKELINVMHEYNKDFRFEV